MASELVQRLDWAVADPPGGAHKSASIAGAFAATKPCSQFAIDASVSAAVRHGAPVAVHACDPATMAAVTMTFGAMVGVKGR